MTIEELRKLIAGHDMSYIFSDSDIVLSEGLAQRDLILDAAKAFPSEDVRKLWNKRVDEQFANESEEFRQPFYWK